MQLRQRGASTLDDSVEYSYEPLARFELGSARALRLIAIDASSDETQCIDDCGIKEITQQELHEWLDGFCKANLWIDSVVQFIDRQYRLNFIAQSSDEIVLEVSWA